VETEEETSTTHVHDDHRLVVIEEGDMEFWNNTGLMDQDERRRQTPHPTGTAARICCPIWTVCVSPAGDQQRDGGPSQCPHRSDHSGLLLTLTTTVTPTARCSLIDATGSEEGRRSGEPSRAVCQPGHSPCQAV
jgi:hypothetical protein